MVKTNITVTMPIEEYERLLMIEETFNSDIKMFEKAHVNGVATMTDLLRKRIEDIYL